MVSILSLLNNTKSELKQAGIENYNNEAALILEKVTGIKKYELAIKGGKAATDEQFEQISDYITRRKNGEPLQYILGEWEFYGLNFKVGKGVLIPRQDTETLIDVVLQEFICDETENPVIADLCSGSGCIAVTLEKMIDGAKVFAVELSAEALPFLSENVRMNGSSVQILAGDVLDERALNSLPELDCIVSNPPYLTDGDMQILQKEVSFEPQTALFGGRDGLDFYHAISSLWARKLRTNGLVAFEVGINQAEDVGKILEQNGYSNVSFQKDLCGITRVVYARKSV